MKQRRHARLLWVAGIGSAATRSSLWSCTVHNDAREAFE